MVKEFVFPDVGEGIHEGTIVKWHFKEGDAVKADQTIVEVETDKAVVELPSPASGTILKINYQAGQVVKVGEVLVAIGEPGEKYAPSARPAAETKPAEAKPAEPKPAPLPEQARVEAPKEPAQAEILAEKPASAAPSPGHAMASPATRRLARELGVDLAKVSGSGPGGRITDEDVKAFGTAPKEAPAKEEAAEAAPQAPAPQKGPKPYFEEGDERIKLTHLRRVIADRMLYSKTHIPHACGMDYCDVTKLAQVREKEKKNFEPKGVKLTFLPFMVKAAAIALKQFPDFNSNFDNENSELVRRKKINIGIAVDTPDGLMVPVIKDVERKSIIEIAQDIESLAALARERKLKLEDIRGGTFTITNIGSVGGMYSTPVINPPEVAIMGVHRIKDLPLVVEGRILPRKVLGLSLCFDHRVVDGASATSFMNAVKQHLEDPDLMLVDMI